MTRAGFSKIAAIRRLLHLGVLVRRHENLQTDLLYGTRYALREGIIRMTGR
jgi:hypothetical protein